MVDPISLAKRYSQTTARHVPYSWSIRIVDIIVFPIAMAISIVLLTIMFTSMALTWPVYSDNRFVSGAAQIGMYICMGIAAALLWRIVF